jgi:hypothetical protein
MNISVVHMRACSHVHQRFTAWRRVQAACCAGNDSFPSWYGRRIGTGRQNLPPYTSKLRRLSLGFFRVNGMLKASALVVRLSGQATLTGWIKQLRGASEPKM